MDGKNLNGMVVSVSHPNYGVLFAAMIEGSGILITDVDEEGIDIPFLTTEEILRQLMKFGFYITYDVKDNLPIDVFVFLAKLEDLGYDKITRIALESYDVSGNKLWLPTIIVMKSEFNPDLLTFDCKVTKKAFQAKLSEASIINVTHEPGMVWDWVTYIANISDLLDENVEEDKDNKPKPPVPPRLPIPVIQTDSDGLTIYSDEDSDDDLDTDTELEDEEDADSELGSDPESLSIYTG